MKRLRLETLQSAQLASHRCDEARARAFEFTVAAYRTHIGVDLESAKLAVIAILKRGAAP